MKRGDLYWVDLIPRSGSEQRGRRPVLIIVESDDGSGSQVLGIKASGFRLIGCVHDDSPAIRENGHLRAIHECW